MNDRDAEGPGVFVSVGVSKSGKTFGVKREVFEYAKRGVQIIAIDRTREWDEFPQSLAQRVAIVTSVDAARAALAKGCVLAVVRVSSKTLEKECERACAWAAEKGPNDTRRPEMRGVAIPEAHRVAPNVPGVVGGSEAIDDCVTAFRHANVRLWLDTQRVARLSATAIEQAEIIRVYACGPRDVGKIADDFAMREDREALEAAIRECGRRKLAGEPGWHIKLQQTAVAPPFELEREKA